MQAEALEQQEREEEDGLVAGYPIRNPRFEYRDRP
jgi:hypothetical protein